MVVGDSLTDAGREQTKRAIPNCLELLARKAHPALGPNSGMRFPLAARLGNWGPFFGQIPGCIFRLRAPGKLCPILDAHCGMHFPQLIGATHLSLSPMTTDSKSPAVGADCRAHEERLVCGRFAWRPRERQRSRDYSWMRVPERPAMVSAALSRAPMMQVRPLRERANLMAARTLGSMEPLPN